MSYQSLFFSNLLKKTPSKYSKPSFEGFEGAKNRVLEESKNDEKILSEKEVGDNKIETTLVDSMKMSKYLVAFVIGEL